MSEAAEEAGFGRRRFLSGIATLGSLATSVSKAHAQGSPLTVGNLRGMWEGQERNPLGVMRVEVLFFPNGTYRRQHWWQNLMTFDTGSYSIAQNWIHFSISNYGPPSRARPLSDTWIVTQFDGRALQATVGGVSFVSVRRK